MGKADPSSDNDNPEGAKEDQGGIREDFLEGATKLNVEGRGRNEPSGGSVSGGSSEGLVLPPSSYLHNKLWQSSSGFQYPPLTWGVTVRDRSVTPTLAASPGREGPWLLWSLLGPQCRLAQQPGLRKCLLNEYSSFMCVWKCVKEFEVSYMKGVEVQSLNPQFPPLRNSIAVVKASEHNC